jgi:hypothetical protein
MPAALDPLQFTDSGLFLVFPDGEPLSLTYENIERRAHALLSDPKRIPLQVIQAEAFQQCTICPKRGSGDTCHAIRPVMAVWESFDKHVSHDRVTAVYRAAGSDSVIAAETTMQRALQYVSVLSLLYYCDVGKQYWRCFHGIHPLMRTEELVARLYLNMFWTCGGDLGKTRELAQRFHDDVSTTTSCQMARIRLFCHTDSFLNALVLTQIASELLICDVEEIVDQQLDAFAQSAPA